MGIATWAPMKGHSKMNERSGRDILYEMAVPGRMLVFIDDSGTPGKPLPDLAADFHFLCGVAMTSDAYAAAKDRILSELLTIGNGIREFHTVEIVNPSKTSPWRGVSLDARQEALVAAIDVLKGAASSILHCFVSGEQYDAELKPRILAAVGRAQSPKNALQHVFFNSLIPFLQRTGEDVAIVMDSVAPLSNAIRIQAAADPIRLYEGGVIHVDSKDEPGIQLADLTAYMVNRVYHARQRLMEGKKNPFDEIIVDAVFDLLPKFINVLELPPNKSESSTQS
ncbi:DUF3800 domain-containing protein [Sorangium sp. So ce834]|uniref:DUF3800 domain-containing protein n=1 Tax=Sorangium sp. So ce834 TaxID=3133321 RepID=UPI003F631088